MNLLMMTGPAASNLVPVTAPIVPNQASTLNPVLKLSSESSANSKKGNHKRNVSLPAQSRPILNGTTGTDVLSLSGANLPPGGISEGGHYFLSFNEMTKVEFCSGCYHSLWGDLNNYRCAKCLMFVHSWCLKNCAALNSCENLDQSAGAAGGVGAILPAGVQLRSTSTREPSRKKQRIKSDKKTSVIEMLTGKMAFQRQTLSEANNLHRSFSSLSSSSFDFSSSSSSDFDEDFNGAASVQPGQDDEQHLIGDRKQSNSGSAITSPVQGGLTVTSTLTSTCARAPLPVNRSGSFNQRKKTKSSASGSTPRKRSDPALTSRHMSTITGGMSGSIDSPTPPVLTSAQSSGALLSYASSMSGGTGSSVDPTALHQLQHQISGAGRTGQSFRPLGKGQMKNMTASDSSLMSATTTIHPSSGLSTNQSSINLTNNASSNTSSPRHNRRGRKKTADSAIHGCVSGSESETDDTAPLTSSKTGEEFGGYDNESIQPISSIDDVTSGGVSPPKSMPPPLPPRPVSEKRRQIKAEIVESEMNHYEALRFIRKVYQRPLRKERNIFSAEQMNQIFGNTKQLKVVHKKICKEMRSAHVTEHDAFDTGTLEKTLHDIFTGDLGCNLETEASIFCANQKLGGGMELFNKRRNDSRLKALFDNELKTKEMPECRWARLSLQDLMGSVFQRPLRYPLLLDRLLHATPSDTQAYKHLEMALHRSRKIVESVNEYTKKEELKARLEEIIRKTEQTLGSKELVHQLQQQELIHEGPLVWRHTKAKVADVLLILTNQMLLVLSRDSSGDRYSLKKHTNPTTKLPYKLDIRMDDLLTRDVATDPTAFFLVSKNQDVFYEFAATTQQECKQWKDAITGAINEYREKNPNLVNQAVASKSTSMNRLQDLASKASLPSGPPPPPPEPTSMSASNSSGNLQAMSPPASLLNRPLPKLPTEEPILPPPPPPPPLPTNLKDAAIAVATPPKFAGTIQNVTQDVTESDLVQFNQVKVNESRVHYATPPSGSFPGIVADPDQVFNDRWRIYGANVERWKPELNELMVLCDIEGHDDSAIALQKAKLVTDLIELAIKIDNNNRPTRQPFNQLVARTRSFIRSLNDENNLLDAKEELLGEDSKSVHSFSTFSQPPPLPPRYEDLVNNIHKTTPEDHDNYDDDDDDQRSNKSQTSQKSECLQIIEDLSDLQINEFQQNLDNKQQQLSTTSTTFTSTTSTSKEGTPDASNAVSSSVVTTSEVECSTTVVSYEVNSAIKLVASSTIPSATSATSSSNAFNPFTVEGIELITTPLPTSSVTFTPEVNPFSVASVPSGPFDGHVITHAQTISSSTTVTSSSTTVISTDLYEVTSDVTSATIFDALLNAAAEDINFDDPNGTVPPLPLSVPPSPATTTHPPELSNVIKDSDNLAGSTHGEQSKSQVFTL